MGHRKRKIRTSLMILSIVPLVGFGLMALLISSKFIYNGLKEEVEAGLDALVHTSYQAYDLQYPGDFVMQGGLLMKGKEEVSSHLPVIDGIKRETGADLTLFFGDERYLTTIRNADGSRATGTKADSTVAQIVLRHGRNYFSDSVMVNGVKYFGYYMPVKNSDQKIVGMVFAGRQRAEVMERIGGNIFLVCALAAGILVCVIVVVCYFSRKMIYALNSTEKFLSEIAKGDLTARIDPYVLERRDEIGEMGRFAVVLQKSIAELVGKDPLTGLANRRSCDIVLKSLTEQERRQRMNFTVVMADIDFFKKVNDTYGHQAGDEVLRNIAKLMTEHMERLGFVFRWGGEEFLLIYEDMGEEEAVCHLKKLQKQIDNMKICWDGEEIQTTMTYGLIDYYQERELENLIRMADENLYIGKKNGRDRIVGSRINTGGETD